ncbi:hypothetical protein ACFLX3_04175 [Chloroflexota bacterium]
MKNNVYMNAQFIDAKDKEGEIVFSEIYSLKNKKYRLQKIEEGLYKAVIPPLQNYTPSPQELPVGGGSPLFSLIIENQSDHVLTIYHGSVIDIATNQVSWATNPIGDVSPGQQITIENMSLNSGWYPIKAIDRQGETIFSEIYTFKTKDKYHLQRIEERLYKGVIPPLGNN